MTKLQNEDMKREHKTKTIRDRWTLLSRMLDHSILSYLINLVLLL